MIAKLFFHHINILFSFRHSGFKLAVVHHLDMPLMNQIGINIAPGTDVQVAIIPTIIDTDEEAFTYFDPPKRECYNESEFQFDFLPNTNFQYQMSNCLFEALVQKTIKECGCNPNALGALNFNLTGIPCYGKNITCQNEIFSKYLLVVLF